LLFSFIFVLSRRGDSHPAFSHPMHRHQKGWFLALIVEFAFHNLRRLPIIMHPGLMSFIVAPPIVS
jgi:hypothetical protein